MVIPYGYPDKAIEAHRQAAQALADKMGWEGAMVCGSLKGGYVFVFVEDQLEEV